MGFLIREVKSSISACRAVLLPEEAPDFNYVHLSDPDTFVTGGLHRNPKVWEEILADRPLADTIKKIGFATKWILHKISQHFKVAQHSFLSLCIIHPYFQTTGSWAATIGKMQVQLKKITF